MYRPELNAKITDELLRDGVIPSEMVSDEYDIQRAITTIVGIYYLSKLKDANLFAGGNYSITESGAIMVEQIIARGWKMTMGNAAWFVHTDPCFNGNADMNAAMAAMLYRISDIGLEALLQEVTEMWEVLSDQKKQEVMEDFERQNDDTP